jgi:carboxymethylenebutenolidase
MPNTVTLDVKGANQMNAYVSMPEGNGPFPAVMVFQEAFGVNHHIRSIADRIAKEGYVAIAPELFHRTAPPGFEASYTDFPSVQPHFAVITTDTLEADIQSTYDWLQTQEQVDKSKIGCIGFCLGGRVSFIANTFLKLQAAVSFYGGGMHALADRAANAGAPQLLFWGGKDTHIKPEDIDTVTNALKEAGKDYVNVVISYADHGFNCDERASYNPDAAHEAWAMTQAFFKNKFGLNK